MVTKALSGGNRTLPEPYRKWIMFIIGMLLLYFFAFTFLPFLSGFLGFTEAHNIIIEENIEAGAWFYIFVEQIRDIEPRVRAKMSNPY